MSKTLTIGWEYIVILLKTMAISFVCVGFFVTLFSFIYKHSESFMESLLWKVLIFEGALLVGFLAYLAYISVRSFRQKEGHELRRKTTLHLLNGLSSGVLPQSVLDAQFLFKGIPDPDWISATYHYVMNFSHSHLSPILHLLESNGLVDSLCQYLEKESHPKYRLQAIELLAYFNSEKSIPILSSVAKSSQLPEQMAAILTLTQYHSTQFLFYLTILRETTAFSWLFIGYIFSKSSNALTEHIETLLNSEDERIVAGTFFALDPPSFYTHRDRVLDYVTNTPSKIIKTILITRILELKFPLPDDLLINWVTSSNPFDLRNAFRYIRLHPNNIFLPHLLKRLTDAIPGIQLDNLHAILAFGHPGVELLRHISATFPHLNVATTSFLKEFSA